MFDSLHPDQIEEAEGVRPQINLDINGIMLFIVTGRVEKLGYMQDRPEKFEVMHPVEAVDEDEAEEIFKDHFRSKSDSYGVTYSAYVTDVFEALSKQK